MWTPSGIVIIRKIVNGQSYELCEECTMWEYLDHNDHNFGWHSKANGQCTAPVLHGEIRESRRSDAIAWAQKNPDFWELFINHHTPGMQIRELM